MRQGYYVHKTKANNVITNGGMNTSMQMKELHEVQVKVSATMTHSTTVWPSRVPGVMDQRLEAMDEEACKPVSMKKFGHDGMHAFEIKFLKEFITISDQISDLISAEPSGSGGHGSAPVFEPAGSGPWEGPNAADKVPHEIWEMKFDFTMVLPVG